MYLLHSAYIIDFLSHELIGEYAQSTTNTATTTIELIHDSLVKYIEILINLREKNDFSKMLS